jgi:uncharacterized membrane protein
MSMPAKTSKYAFRVLNVLLGVAFLIEICVPNYSRVLDAVTVVLAAVASVAALGRQLPLQNVLPAAIIAAVIGSIAHGISANPNLSLPFGPLVFTPAAGGKIFNSVPWSIPLLWVFAIFNSRGVARLILRPWRKIKVYGFWLIGLTAGLAVAFDAALEPFAGAVRHFWRWQPTKISITWYGATLLDFLGWACVSLLILMFATPSLIRKQPGSPSAPDYHPLLLWLGALLLFAIDTAITGRWGAVGLDAVIAAVTAYFALRGAKW